MTEEEGIISIQVSPKIIILQPEDLRALNKKNDKGNAVFWKDIYEIHGRVGYSYEVKGSEDNVKQRRYKPHEALGYP